MMGPSDRNALVFAETLNRALFLDSNGVSGASKYRGGSPAFSRAKLGWYLNCEINVSWALPFKNGFESAVRDLGGGTSWWAMTAPLIRTINRRSGRIPWTRMKAILGLPLFIIVDLGVH